MSSRKIVSGIELLRVAAILGVIWFHTDGLAYRRVGFSGLIAFVLIATVLAGPSARTASFSAFLNKRLRRLLLPWAFWCLAYLILNKISGRPAFPNYHDPLSSLLAGPWIGLWYLPFAFFASLLAFAGYRASGHTSPRVALFAALGAGLGLLFVAEFARKGGDLIWPWAQWLHAAPAIPFGLAIAHLHAEKKNWWEAAAICCAPLVYAGCSRFADPGLALTYLIAVPVTTIAFLFPVKLPDFVILLGSLCMGVYLVHGGLISALNHALPPHSSPYILFLLTAVFAFVASSVLKRVPLIRDTI